MRLLAVLPIVLLLSGPAPAQPGVARLSVGEATIEYPEGRQEAAWRFHDAYLPARGRVLRVTGAVPPRGLVIELVRSRGALKDRVRQETGYDLPGWVGGVALPGRNRIVIRLDLSSSEWDRCQGILTHELSHIAVHHALSGPDAAPLPRWLDEGIAQHAEGRLFSPSKPELAMRAFFGTLIPLDELEASFPRSEGASSLAYAQAHSFVAYLVRQVPGRQPLKDLIRKMARGVALEDAAGHVFLSGMDELEARWRADLRDDRSWVPRVVGQVAVGLFLIVVVVLGASRIVRRRRAIERRWDDEEEDDETTEPAPPVRRPPIRRLRRDEQI